MKLHELAPAEGSKKEHFRVGRGHGSGNGKTAGLCCICVWTSQEKGVLS